MVTVNYGGLFLCTRSGRRTDNPRRSPTDNDQIVVVSRVAHKRFMPIQKGFGRATP
jgi:hypothetical protein